MNLLSLHVSSLGRLIDDYCDNDNKCNGHGKCVDENNTMLIYSCFCDEGFYLADCSLND